MSFFSNLTKNIEGVAKVVGGFAAGGPAGAALAGASLLGGPKPGAAVGAAGIASRLPSPFTGVVPPGSSGFINQIFGLTPITPTAGQGCPRGYHLNKHALPASRSHGAVGPRSICVRNRHMNPLNHRADSRALRRLKRADKMTRKIHNLFHHTHRAPAKKR